MASRAHEFQPLPLQSQMCGDLRVVMRTGGAGEDPGREAPVRWRQAIASRPSDIDKYRAHLPAA